MITTGLIGAAIALVLMGGLGWAIIGAAAGVAALLGVALSALVMAGGQLCLIQATEPRRTLVMALIAYGGGLALFGLGLYALSRSNLGLPGLWLGLGAGVGAYGFLGGAILAYSRARIPLMIPTPPAVEPPSAAAETGKLQRHE